ncbi:MAG: RNA polymerase sigma factor [Silvanigrellales bacterium]|nr:RNA polymerase sigma factor [Silvanigrellales bacterium]
MENDANDMLWKDAFARLSEPYWEALLRFAVSLCHSQERAEDLLQMALLRGVRFFRKFCEKNFGADNPQAVDALFADAARARHFKNWLYKILKNVYLDDQSALSKWSFDSDEEMLENRADDTRALPGPFEKAAPFMGEQAADPQAVTLEEEAFFSLAADDDLKNDLEVLSDRQRSVLYLIAEEYSYKEVASILNIPIGTVMSTLSRGLGKLRSRIGQRTGVVPQGPPTRKGAAARRQGISSGDSEVLTQRGDEHRDENVSSEDRKVAEK